MRTRTLSLQVGAYSDGSYHLAVVQSTYERGRMTTSDVVASRQATRTELELAMEKAVQYLVRHADQDQRQRQVAAGERE